MSDGCRASCLAAGEPLVGSAGSAGVFVAIAWPRRRWHPDKAGRSAGLPEALATLEAETKRRTPKLALRVFQRGPGADTERVEVLVHRAAGESYRLSAVPRARLPEAVADACAGRDAPDGSEPLGPELLVCTDGAHDACCARFGRPFYSALRDAVERTRLDVGVAECSHLGGHRFAANALALPSGDLYGRLEARDAEPLLRALAAGRTLRYRHRGTLGAPELLQVADAFLAARLPEGADWALGPADTDAGHVQATLEGGERALVVRCRRESFQGPGSCGEDDEVRERWVAVELDEAP